MKIITDTGSMLSRQEVKRLDVDLIPLQVELKGKNYKDYFDISSKEFIELIQDGIPNSSQPSVGAAMEVFDEAKEGLYIAMTSGLSSTYASALGLQNQHPEYKDIEIYNSKTLAGPQAYLVQLAAHFVKSEPKEKIKQRLDHCLSECKSYLIPVDFDYLKRNGRLSTLAAVMSGLLKIKPIVFHKPGMEKLEKFGVGRTWNQSIEAILSDMAKAHIGPQHKVYVSHAHNPEISELFINKIQERFVGIDIEELLLTPVMITQGGPGCIAVQYILKDPEFK